MHIQPRELAEIKGDVRKNPQRYRARVPKHESKMSESPPEHLSEEAKACWFELRENVIAEVMTKADAVVLEVLANLLAEYREDPKAIAAPKLGHLIACLARLGMTPCDRQKLAQHEPKKSANQFNDF